MDRKTTTTTRGAYQARRKAAREAAQPPRLTTEARLEILEELAAALELELQAKKDAVTALRKLEERIAALEDAAAGAKLEQPSETSSGELEGEQE